MSWRWTPFFSRHQIQHYTGQLAKDTSTHLHELSNGVSSLSQTEQRQWRLQRERLHNDFTKALNSFQVKLWFTFSRPRYLLGFSITSRLLKGRLHRRRKRSWKRPKALLGSASPDLEAKIWSKSKKDKVGKSTNKGNDKWWCRRSMTSNNYKSVNVPFVNWRYLLEHEHHFAVSILIFTRRHHILSRENDVYAINL